MANPNGNPGNKGGGRKPKSVEVNITRYYEDCLPKVFIKVKEMLESKIKKDRLWAIEWLKSGLVKMIPQKIGGDKNNPIEFRPIYDGHSLQRHNGNPQNIQSNQENTGG